VLLRELFGFSRAEPVPTFRQDPNMQSLQKTKQIHFVNVLILLNYILFREKVNPRVKTETPKTFLPTYFLTATKQRGLDMRI
jgi:hypothetical protein